MRNIINLSLNMFLNFYNIGEFWFMSFFGFSSLLIFLLFWTLLLYFFEKSKEKITQTKIKNRNYQNQIIMRTKMQTTIVRTKQLFKLDLKI